MDINVNKEWWASAHKEHRRALFVAAITALGETGQRVIPEDFSTDALRPLDPLPPMLEAPD